jgi:hypothetical protein
MPLHGHGTNPMSLMEGGAKPRPQIILIRSTDLGVPKKSQSAPAKPKPLYRRKPQKLHPQIAQNPADPKKKSALISEIGGQEIGHPIAPSHFTLREDGAIQMHPQMTQNSADEKKKSASIGEICRPKLIFSSANPWLRLYHGNCLELLDAIAAKYPDGRFDTIFADPPYFLSNGGITCHAGESHFMHPRPAWTG